MGVVDDQPGKLLTYEVKLRELGENLIKATSGKEALSILLRTQVAIVLLDVSMPEMDGFELADMIHSHPRLEQTAIIFVSAVRMTDVDRLWGYQRGGVDYVSVPVIPELLRAKVRVFADLHRKSRQLEELDETLRDDDFIDQAYPYCRRPRVSAASDSRYARIASWLGGLW